MTALNESPPELDASVGAERGQNSPKFDGRNSAGASNPPQSPNADEWLAFLRRAYPAGPWALTAIRPDKKGIVTKTFSPETEADARAWVENYNGKRNLYWSVNPPRHAVTDKAKREDIKAVCYLHVDVDPRAGEPLEEEHARIAALFGPRLPAGVPLPTCVIFSGGGYQAFWKLREPIPIDGDVARADDAARYNRQLENLLGGDNCHDVSRIMRLPATWNVPDEKKLKKGRKPALARVVELHNERVYDLSQFTQAPAQSASGTSPGVEVPEDVPRLTSVDELDKWNVPARVKLAIVQGRDPEKALDGDSSRSGWLFYVCCQLVRSEVPDGTIYAVISDPGFGISESVLDKGRSAKSYALRQIARAKEAKAASEGDPVAFVNQHYFAALEGGKVRFYREDKTQGRATLAMMNSEAFTFELAPHAVTMEGAKGKTLKVPYSTIWKASAQRRYYGRGFVLDPTGGERADEYNLWRGFGVEPRPGDWSLMRAHIRDVLAAGNQAHADYILKWSAWAVQNPAIPPRVALVFKGDEGIGKGAYANALVQVFGEHGLRIQTMSHLTGKFNAHLRHLCMLYADEAVAPGDEEGTGALKGLITEPTIPIEAKGVDVVNAENHLHIIMSSNAKWIVPAGDSARRFAMFDVPDTYLGEAPYFAALFGQLKSGGINGMLHDLLSVDLSGWHPDTHRPETKALVDQKIRSLKGVEREWYNILLTGELPLRDAGKLPPGFVRVSTGDVVEFIQFRLRGERVTANDLGSLFGKDGMGFQQITGQRPRGFVLPPLSEARTRWNECKFAVEWPSEPETLSSGWHDVHIKPEF